jgi:hypothetical protein
MKKLFFQSLSSQRLNTTAQNESFEILKKIYKDQDIEYVCASRAKDPVIKESSELFDLIIMSLSAFIDYGGHNVKNKLKEDGKLVLFSISRTDLSMYAVSSHFFFCTNNLLCSLNKKKIRYSLLKLLSEPHADHTTKQMRQIMHRLEILNRNGTNNMKLAIWARQNKYSILIAVMILFALLVFLVWYFTQR